MTDVPDLRSLLAEATPPTSSCTVPLKQGLRAEIERLEAELAEIAADAPRKRMGAESPLKVKAREIEALREQMRASEVTFRFQAPTADQRDKVRREMGGRDNPDELDLRATAAVCVEPAGVTFETLRDLRDKIGVQIYEATIKDASDKVWGREWSVPFSLSASHILGTET